MLPGGVLVGCLLRPLIPIPASLRPVRPCLGLGCRSPSLKALQAGVRGIAPLPNTFPPSPCRPVENKRKQ